MVEQKSRPRRCRKTATPSLPDDTVELNFAAFVAFAKLKKLAFACQSKKR